jgi:hypothetical protein
MDADASHEAVPEQQTLQDAHQRVADGLESCIRLSRLRAEAGDLVDASRYIVGALADLEPELAVLAAALLLPH